MKNESGRKMSNVEQSPGTGLLSDHYTPMVRRYNYNLELSKIECEAPVMSLQEKLK